MLAMLAKLLKILNSDASPGQISLGFAFALFIGLTPFFSLHNLFIFLLVCLIRVNLGGFFFASAIFALLAFLLDPVSIAIGEQLLAHPDLQTVWTGMYQSDVWRAFKFNHTLLLGSVVLSCVLFIPVWIVFSILIKLYRSKLMAWFEKLKIVKFLKASKFYQAYERLGA
ncbi:MAG: TIGR03546 family protein [Bermanella sp.]